MLVRGVIVTYETIRQWCAKFGTVYAAGLRRRQPRPGDKWHLDEVFLTINGRRHYLWRAVDQDGNVSLDILVQPRAGCPRDRRAGRSPRSCATQWPMRIASGWRGLAQRAGAGAVTGRCRRERPRWPGRPPLDTRAPSPRRCRRRTPRASILPGPARGRCAGAEAQTNQLSSTSRQVLERTFASRLVPEGTTQAVRTAGSPGTPAASSRGRTRAGQLQEGSARWSFLVGPVQAPGGPKIRGGAP